MTKAHEALIAEMDAIRAGWTCEAGTLDWHAHRAGWCKDVFQRDGVEMTRCIYCGEEATVEAVWAANPAT